MVVVSGCRAPTQAPVGRQRDVDGLLDQHPRVALGLELGRARGRAPCRSRPRAAPTRWPAAFCAAGGSAPISRLASASGERSPSVGQPGRLQLVERGRRRERRQRRRHVGVDRLGLRARPLRPGRSCRSACGIHIRRGVRRARRVYGGALNRVRRRSPPAALYGVGVSDRSAPTLMTTTTDDCRASSTATTRRRSNSTRRADARAAPPGCGCAAVRGRAVAVLVVVGLTVGIVVFNASRADRLRAARDSAHGRRARSTWPRSTPATRRGAATISCDVVRRRRPAARLASGSRSGHHASRWSRVHHARQRPRHRRWSPQHLQARAGSVQQRARTAVSLRAQRRALADLRPAR